MLTPSEEIVKVMSVFASGMTAPAFNKALTLMTGVVLSIGARTVCAALRAMGLDGREHGKTFTKYHRVLARDRWSPMAMSAKLLQLLIDTFLTADMPLIVIIDDTLERRCSDKIRNVCCYRDSSRSGLSYLVKTFGLRWMCVMLLVKVPWSRRPWALPIAAILTRSSKRDKQLGRRHTSLTGWAQYMAKKLRRWQPEREIVLLADRSYASVAMIQCCQRLPKPIKFVSNLRLDAGLYELPVRKKKTGPLPKKGSRQASPQAMLAASDTPFQESLSKWYGGGTKLLHVFSRHSIWSAGGNTPVPIRWVLTTCPDDLHYKPTVFFCSDPDMPAAEIIEFYVLRWNIEVTFEEARLNLGFETQRQWSDNAIARSTPCLLGVFSLVTVLAARLFPAPACLPMRIAAWYDKQEPTFSDALAAVRLNLWRHQTRPNSRLSQQFSDTPVFQPSLFDHLASIAAYA